MLRSLSRGLTLALLALTIGSVPVGARPLEYYEPPTPAQDLRSPDARDAATPARSTLGDPASGPRIALVGAGFAGLVALGALTASVRRRTRARARALVRN